MSVRRLKPPIGRWILTILFSVGSIATVVSLRAASSVPLTVASGRVSIAGTSNIHAYTASTTDVRVVNVRLGDGLAGPNFWTHVLAPGAVETFEVAIGAATLSSPREGLDKNMHKALKVADYPDITFRLLRLGERAETPGKFRAQGILKIAGVEREVALDLVLQQQSDSIVTVKGEVPLLMTDFGIAPPKAMLGMLKTDPKVTVTFETVLSSPLT